MHLLVVFLLLLTSCMEQKKEMRNTVALPYVMSSHPDPFNILFSGDWVVSTHLWATLVDIDESGKIVPYLAKSWASNSEGDIWELEMEPGLKWSDGSPITIDQIVNSLKSSHKGTSHSDVSREVRQIEAFGGKVKFILNRPLPNFLLTLTYHDWGIVHPSNIETNGKRVKVVPVGPFSGPFKVGDNKEGQVLDQFHLSPNSFFIKNNNFDDQEVRLSYFKNCEKILEQHGDILTAKVFRDNLSSECEGQLKKKGFNIILDQPTWILKVDFTDRAMKSLPLPSRLIVARTVLKLAKNEYKQFGVARATGLRGAHLEGSLSESELEAVLSNFDSTIGGTTELPETLSIAVMEDWSDWKSFVWLKSAFKRLKVDLKVKVLSKQEFYSEMGSGKLQQNFDLLFIPLGVGDLEPDGTWRIARKYFYSDVITPEELSEAYLETDLQKRNELYKELGRKLLQSGRFIPLAMNSDYLVIHESVDISNGPAIRNGIYFPTIGRH